MSDLHKQLIEPENERTEKEIAEEKRSIERKDKNYIETGLTISVLILLFSTLTFFILFTIEKAVKLKSNDRINAIYFFGCLWIVNIPWLIYFSKEEYKRSPELQTAMSLKSAKMLIAMVIFFVSFLFFLVIVFEQIGFLPVVMYDCYQEGTTVRSI